MNERTPLRVVIVDDRVGLMEALREAFQGGQPVLPVAADSAPVFEDLPAGTALVIRTSGSSGIPKAVALAATALQASAEATHERLGGPGQWLIALPTQLISGAQMLVRSIVAGTDPVYLGGATAHFDPAEFFAAAETMTHERRYVSLVPVQLTRLLDCIEMQRAHATNSDSVSQTYEQTLRRFDAVLVGGQSVSLELRSRAHKLGLALRRSYGMTETAGGCVYDGVEIGDTKIRIRQGEVQIAGPTLALGYVGDDALTAAHFIEADGERWYATGDSGELLGGMLTVTGRLDRVIVSGGVNVSLDEIERIVSEQRGWSGAVAAGIPDAEWGERPVIVRPDVTDPDRAPFDEVRHAVRAALGVAAAPASEVVCVALPRLAGDKPDRAAINVLVRQSVTQPSS